jgi:hypothetical protein
MKKLLLLLLPILFASCSNPSLQAGGWLAPTLPAIGCIIFGILAVHDIKYIGKKDSYYKVFSIICALATIGILLIAHFNK